MTKLLSKTVQVALTFSVEVTEENLAASDMDLSHDVLVALLKDGLSLQKYLEYKMALALGSLEAPEWLNLLLGWQGNIAELTAFGNETVFSAARLSGVDELDGRDLVTVAEDIKDHFVVDIDRIRVETLAPPVSQSLTRPATVQRRATPLVRKKRGWKRWKPGSLRSLIAGPCPS
jgi:hypothetical protein